MKLTNRVLSISLCIVLILCAVSSLTAMTGCFEDPRLVTRLKVYSNSMAPTIKQGDTISIYKVEPEDIKVGDIIAFKHIIDEEEHIITHRVVKIIENGDNPEFETKGDNNTTKNDFTVTSSDIIGRYEPDK